MNMSKCYMEMLFVGEPGSTDCFRTGHTAKFKNDKATKAMFEELRVIAIPLVRARFMVDLWDGDNIVDTVGLNDDGFKQVIGRPPKSRAYYKKVDEQR